MKISVITQMCLFIAFASTSCDKPNGAAHQDMAEDTLTVWKTWAEASDDGLWESIPEKQIVLREISTVGGGDIPQFYSPVDIAVSGDTLFVTDSATESVVCMKMSTDELFWKFGEPGEGPGCFSGISCIAVSDENVFISNQNNARVTVLDRSGLYQGDISVLNPYDLTVIDDTVLVVLSLAESKIINLYNVLTLEKIAEFGQWETTLEQNIVYSNRNLYVTALPDSRIAVGSFYESMIRIYDLKNQQVEASFFRKTPLIPPPNEGGIIYIHCNDICCYADSSLFVLLPVVTVDKTLSTSRADLPRIASIGLIDRYTLSGQYCDTIVAPGTCSGVMEISGDYIYIVDCLEGFVKIYKVVSASD